MVPAHVTHRRVGMGAAAFHTPCCAEQLLIAEGFRQEARGRARCQERDIFADLSSASGCGLRSCAALAAADPRCTLLKEIYMHNIRRARNTM
jgi:hypothetical protein